MQPFNIDAKLNGAYIALGSPVWRFGLLEDIGDLDSRRPGFRLQSRRMRAAFSETMMGYKPYRRSGRAAFLPSRTRSSDYTDFTFKTIVDSTVKRAIALAESTGGKRSGENLTIVAQTAETAKLELWDDYGSPVERVAVADSRWTWKGDWRADKNLKLSAAKGAEAAIDFEGTGVMIVGPYLQNGGTADIYLDGKLSRKVDVYPDENAQKNGESVWHEFKLKPGKHWFVW